METIFNQFISLAHTCLQFAINGIWLGVLIALSGALLLRFARQMPASTKYKAWALFISMAIVLPLTIGQSPKLYRLLPEKDMSFNENTKQPYPSIIEKTDTEFPIAASRQSSTNKNILNRNIDKETQIIPVEPQSPAPEEKATLKSILIELLPVYLFTLWTVITSLLIIRLCWGYYYLHKIKKNANLPDSNILRKFEHLVNLTGLSRPVDLRISSIITTPVAVGYSKAAVIIPENLLRLLSDDELDAIIIHELAHIDRCDDWFKLVQKILEAILFFNPALQWLGRQMDFEREIACDERVIAITRTPKKYATCLTRLIQHSVYSKRTALAPGAIMSKQQIFKRFEILLNNKKTKTGRFYKTGFVLAVTFMVIAIGLFTLNSPAIAITPTGLTYTEISQIINEEIFGEDNANDMDDPKQEENNPIVENTQDISEAVIAVINDDTALLSDEELNIEPVTDNIPSVDVLAANVDDEGIIEKTISTFSGVFDDGKNNLIITDKRGETTVIWSDDGGKYEVSYRGKIAFSDDDRHIESISNRGYLTIQHKNRFTLKELEIRPDRDGSLIYEYYVNRDEEEFGEEAEAWMADILENVIRQTGLGAEERVKKILEKDGIDGVLEEIGYIHADHVKRIYYNFLIEQAELDHEQFSTIIKQASSEFDSDYEMAELLIHIADKCHDDHRLLPAYVEAVGSLDSDYETRRVLEAFTIDERADKEIILAVLKIADDMDSDYEKAELLIGMSRLCRQDDKLIEAYVEAVQGMDSDYETRRVITALGHTKDAGPEYTENLLEIAMKMDSDYEKAELLIDMADYNEFNPELLNLYADAAATLDSDYETRRVLTALGTKNNINIAVLTKILTIVNRMDSDYEISQLLIDFADDVSRDKELKQTYLKANRNIASDYEKAQALKALESSGGIDKEIIPEVLTVTSEIISDYEKRRILEDLIPYCRGDDELEEAMVDVIETIESDYDKDQIYAMLYKQYRSRKINPH